MVYNSQSDADFAGDSFFFFLNKQTEETIHDKARRLFTEVIQITGRVRVGVREKEGARENKTKDEPCASQRLRR